MQGTIATQQSVITYIRYQISKVKDYINTTTDMVLYSTTKSNT